MKKNPYVTGGDTRALLFVRVTQIKKMECPDLPVTGDTKTKQF